MSTRAGAFAAQPEPKPTRPGQYDGWLKRAWVALRAALIAATMIEP
jgi:hypothetical protein